MDAAGDTCAWCAKPAVAQAVVAQAQKTNALRGMLTVPVCGQHVEHFESQGVEIRRWPASR